MEDNSIFLWISGILGLVNTAMIGWAAWKKLKPEVKKMEAEEESENVQTANLNLEGAGNVVKLLRETVEQLKLDLAAERQARQEEIEKEKQARQQDRIYFTRRIKEIDREARDYRLWAARLAKQVIEAGKEPVPFISSLEESDPMLMSISKEQEELSKLKSKRQEDIKNNVGTNGGDTTAKTS